MESVEGNVNDMYMNVKNFSKIIAEKLNINSNTISDYIFANISIVLVRNNEIKKDINKLYNADKWKYYRASMNSTCINHIIITQGTLEQEIYVRKALGILLVAEKDHNIRSNIIKILRKYNPVIYNSIKKFNKKQLKDRYLKMDEATRNIESKFDAAIYFYFAIYRSPEMVDQGFIMSIIKDIEEFEFRSVMTVNIDEQLERYKPEIQKIKRLIKGQYGKIFSYKDIINNDDRIKKLSSFLENMFIINKLDINRIFSNFEFLNIDKIILAYIKTGEEHSNIQLITESIVNGVFMQSLINEYKSSRKLYFEDNEETLHFQLNHLEEKLKYMEEENKKLKSKLQDLNEEKSMHNKNLKMEINKLIKIYKCQINDIDNKNRELEKRLLEEGKYRKELEILRECVFKMNEDYTPSVLDETLDSYIESKKILIIGGEKEWRRKFRSKYPMIRTLNGFNENFDISILNNYDYIFFYTKFMSHATFYRAMNFIRINQCKFGYIGKTNIELVEQEIIEELRKQVDK